MHLNTLKEFCHEIYSRFGRARGILLDLPDGNFTQELGQGVS